MAVPMAIRMIFGASPMPNQTMNTGMSPNSGSVRSICMRGSTAFSPIRLSPAMSASSRPMVPPTAKPTATRSSETASAPWSVPYAGESVVTSVTTVDQTWVGGGSFCAETRPSSLISCQTSSTASGTDEPERRGPAAPEQAAPGRLARLARPQGRNSAGRRGLPGGRGHGYQAAPGRRG